MHLRTNNSMEHGPGKMTRDVLRNVCISFCIPDEGSEAIKLYDFIVGVGAAGGYRPIRVLPNPR